MKYVPFGPNYKQKNRTYDNMLNIKEYNYSLPMTKVKKTALH